MRRYGLTTQLVRLDKLVGEFLHFHNVASRWGATVSYMYGGTTGQLYFNSAPHSHLLCHNHLVTDHLLDSNALLSDSGLGRSFHFSSHC